MIHARDDYKRLRNDPEGRIPDKEPVFLLRGQDLLAAAAVRFWADLAETNGVDPIMVAQARQQAKRMSKWHTHKLPDLWLPDL
jgi:hypothetical protein